MEIVLIIVAVVVILTIIGSIDNNRPVSSWSNEKLHRMHRKLARAGNASTAVGWHETAKKHDAKFLEVTEEIKKRLHQSDTNKDSDDVAEQLEHELENLEAGIRKTDQLSIVLIGTTLEMLQKGFSDRHGSFEEFSKKGGDLIDYINLLIRMEKDYQEQDIVHGEFACRLCVIHASAAYIEKRALEERAKSTIDMIIKKAAQFERK